VAQRIDLHEIAEHGSALIRSNRAAARSAGGATPPPWRALLLALSFGLCGTACAAVGQSTGGGVTGPGTAQDACLAFNMPATDTLFNSQKKVFAHYFAMFAQSMGNKDPTQDYYNVNYLNPAGESSKWQQQGGFLRQRPLGVAVNPSADWRLLSMENEVRMAIARGITGFTIDVLAVKEATDDGSNLHTLLRAAQAVDPRFKIVVMPDIAQFKTDADSVTKIIASVASSPAAYRLADGRLVVTAFNAGANSPEWWSAVFNTLNGQGVKVAFVPTFLGWRGNAAKFAGISYGFGDWGTAIPASARNMQGDPAAAHAMGGKIYMMPVDPQQYRPKGPIYWEAGNSEAFRDAWTSAISGGADWVQLVTWSDFSESSEVEPYTDATLARNIGTGYYDLNGYYAAWFLTGQAPAITHDVLYYFYRREPTTAAAPAQALPNRIINSTAEDSIEVVAFLTAPGTLRISVGGKDSGKNVPAGLSTFKIPTTPGTPVFSLLRGGSSVLSFQGGIQIYGNGGLPSGLSDLTYWSGSGGVSGQCSL
jgi:hypothetical protein